MNVFFFSVFLTLNKTKNYSSLFVFSSYIGFSIHLSLLSEQNFWEFHITNDKVLFFKWIIHDKLFFKVALSWEILDFSMVGQNICLHSFIHMCCYINIPLETKKSRNGSIHCFFSILTSVFLTQLICFKKS